MVPRGDTNITKNPLEALGPLILHAPAVCPGIRPSRVSKNDPLSERFLPLLKNFRILPLCVLLCFFSLFLLVIFGNPPKKLCQKKRLKKQPTKKKRRKKNSSNSLSFPKVAPKAPKRSLRRSATLPAAPSSGTKPWMPGENSCPIWGAVLDGKSWKSHEKALCAHEV